MNIVYPILFGIGSILLIIAAFTHRTSTDLSRYGIKTTAKVVDNIPKFDSDGDVTYKSVLQYRDEFDNAHLWSTKVSSNPPMYKTGKEVEIYYDPSDFNRIRVKSFWGLYRATILLLIFSAPFLIISIGYFAYYYSNR